MRLTSWWRQPCASGSCHSPVAAARVTVLAAGTRGPEGWEDPVQLGPRLGVGGASSAGTPCRGLKSASACQPVRDPPGVTRGARGPLTPCRTWWWVSPQTTQTFVTQAVRRRARNSRALSWGGRSLGPLGQHVLGYRQSHVGSRTTVSLPSKHDTERRTPAAPRGWWSRRIWPGPRAPDVPFGSLSVTPRRGRSLRAQPHSVLTAFQPRSEPFGPFRRQGEVLPCTQVLLPAPPSGPRKTRTRAPQGPLGGTPTAERQSL